MKQKILAGLAALALAPAVLGQAPIYINPSDYIVSSNAVVIDAVSFLNPQGLIFSVSDPFGLARFDFTDCLNFTNKGYMFGSPGYDFYTKTQDGLPPRRADWFVNQEGGPNGGIIDVSGFSFKLSNTGIGSATAVFGLTGNGEVIVRATNIIQSGTIDMGSSGLVSLSGDNVDLTRGTITMTNPAQFFGFFNSGILDGYWGTGLLFRGMNPANNFGVIPGFIGNSIVTNRQFLQQVQNLPMPFTQAYTNQTPAVNSNMLTQVVFLSNTNAAFNTSVFFLDSAGIEVQWQWVSTNWPSLSVTTNSLILLDTFGERTNLQVVANGTAGPFATFIPINYSFFLISNIFGGIPATPTTDVSTAFFNKQLTNPYAAYQAIFTPGASLPTDVAGGDITNQAGRIEITADNSLNLNSSRISSLNYLKLNAPHHFVGSDNAQILTPNSDITLASTNGLLSFTNLMAPFLPFPNGTISLYSARFTNEVTAGGVTTTNCYHVLFVDSELAPITIPLVHSLNLTANNLLISDIINISDSLSLNARSVTITTNASENLVSAGQLNILNPAILWPAATPGLQFFTNSGQFAAQNAVFFGGSRTQPSFDPSSINIPYQAFVNQGLIADQGTYVWARYFENTGTIYSGTGPTELLLGFSVRLHDGAFYSANSDISLTASDLVITNHVLQAGGTLAIAATNYLDDGSYLLNSADSISNKNTWVAGTGLGLATLPAYSSLLGTSVLITNVTRQSAIVSWAGADRGGLPEGFANNAALGRLVLGGTDPGSTFAFLPVNAANAIYVDDLEIVGSLATNKSAGNDLLGLIIPANMKIYYAQASLNGVPNARKLNGRNNGALIWVSNYNTGFFSSTIVNYPPSSDPSFPAGPHRLNAALVQEYADHQLGLIPIAPGQSDTAAPNVPPVYPALVLDDGSSSSGPPTDGGGPPVVSGPARLELPAATRASGPPQGFAQGSYSGLFADTNGIAFNSSGYFTVRTTPQGRYTGKLVLAGRSYPFAGQFNASSGLATTTVSRGALSLRFWVNTADAGQIMGDITGPGWSANVVAFRQATTKSSPSAASLRGAVTLIIPPGSGGPGGAGFGTVKTDAAGNVRWVGSMGDGTKVTQSGFVSSEGLWAAYAPLYGGRGSALGWLQFSATGLTNLSGQCLWVKPAGLGPRYYPQGFTNDVEAFGSAYSRPAAGSSVLQFSAGTLSFTGGGLSAPFSNAIVLDLRNRVTSSDIPAPSVRINSSSGLFTGSASLPSLGKISFQGALFQNGNFGAGFFLGPTQSGEVLLRPAP